MNNEYLKIYGEAFFRLCCQRKVNFEHYLEIIYDLQNIFTMQKKRNFYFIKSLNFFERQKLLTEIFESSLDKWWLQFLHLLNSDYRFQWLLEILNHLQKKFERKLNIKRGTIYSISFLEEKTLKIIENKLKNRLGSKVILKNKIDRSLTSGLRLEIDRYVFDNSISHKILTIKKMLMAKAK